MNQDIIVIIIVVFMFIYTTYWSKMTETVYYIVVSYCVGCNESTRKQKSEVHHLNHLN